MLIAIDAVRPGDDITVHGRRMTVMGAPRPCPEHTLHTQVRVAHEGDIGWVLECFDTRPSATPVTLRKRTLRDRDWLTA